jgi:hypothetical protein
LREVEATGQLRSLRDNLTKAAFWDIEHTEAQTVAAKTVRGIDFASVDFASVDDYDSIVSDVLRFAVVIKLHNPREHLPNVEFLMPMRFKGKPEGEFRMNRVDASTKIDCRPANL